MAYLDGVPRETKRHCVSLDAFIPETIWFHVERGSLTHDISALRST